MGSKVSLATFIVTVTIITSTYKEK
jgi:hypothetical protein